MTPSPADTRLRCPLCYKVYERKDHLRRHLRSHGNTRSFQCSKCMKGFNRADLLHRHEKLHFEKSRKDGKDLAPKSASRVIEACRSCVEAKVKCEDEKPCKRCKARDIRCEVSPRRRQPKNLSEPATLEAEFTYSGLNHENAMAENDSGGSNLNSYADLTLITSSDHEETTNLALTPPGRSEPPITQSQFDDSDIFTSIFQNLTLPRGTEQDVAKKMPNVSDFMHDLDFHLNDLDSYNISMDIFEAPFDSMAAATYAFQTPRMGAHADENQPHYSEISSRSAAFKRSLWSFWDPPKYHNTFSGQEVIRIDESSIPKDSPPGASPEYQARDHLDQDSRDRILMIAHQTCRSRISIPSFPSLDLLNSFVRTFFQYEMSVLSAFIHPHAIEYREVCQELLLSLIAAGSSVIPFKQARKMGLLFQEIVRLALADHFELDNSLTRDLHALQALFLWLEIGTWSGIRRKSEIATSFFQPAYTLLCQQGGLSRSSYTSIIPTAEDTDDELETKWKAWVEQESLKRIALRMFIHDSQKALAFLKNPLVSYAHMMLPAPAPRCLWLAPNAHAWRSAFTSTISIPQNGTPLMIEVFSDLSILDFHSDNVDVQLCCLASLHALANQVWEHRQQSILVSNCYREGRKSHELWCKNRERDLYEELNATYAYCKQQRIRHHEISFLLQFLMMSLHVSLDEIQLFAGKSGEDEARRLLPTVKKWSQSVTARTAVWHASQVLECARQFPPSTLGGFYAIGLYHASMTLWVYGLLLSSMQRQSGVQTPVGSTSCSTFWKLPAQMTSNTKIILNSGDSEDIRAFILLNQGIPGLLLPNSESTAMTYGDSETSACLNSEFQPLLVPRCAMVAATRILRDNYAIDHEDLPSLVSNLIGLMDDLGSLPTGNLEIA